MIKIQINNKLTIVQSKKIKTLNKGPCHVDLQLESSENSNLEEKDGDDISNPAKSQGVHIY